MFAGFVMFAGVIVFDYLTFTQHKLILYLRPILSNANENNRKNFSLKLQRE